MPAQLPDEDSCGAVKSARAAPVPSPEASEQLETAIEEPGVATCGYPSARRDLVRLRHTIGPNTSPRSVSAPIAKYAA
jgi:hypothetical protein